jgi:hypothetical protein
MHRIKACLKPALMIIVWITVLSYTVSMVATVEPTLRRMGRTVSTDATAGPGT